LSPELRGFAASDYVILHSVEDDDTVHVHHVLHGSQEIESHFPH